MSDPKEMMIEVLKLKVGLVEGNKARVAMAINRVDFPLVDALDARADVVKILREAANAIEAKEEGGDECIILDPVAEERMKENDDA